jgi:hypothetical protein
MSTILAHIPWMFTYLRLIPGAAKPRNRAHNIGVQYVNRRVQEGSNIQDLYYHLVSERDLLYSLSLKSEFSLSRKI